MKIKIFSHTDLDGIGCAILSFLAFGKENVEVEYCDYKDIDEKVFETYSNGLDAMYDDIFITDISISGGLAERINDNTDTSKWHLFDHHPTALELNRYDWCEVVAEVGCNKIKPSGTSLLYSYLLNQGYFDKYLEKEIKSDNHAYRNISKFTKLVRDYDTWRWKELGDEGLVSKKLNDVFHILGRDQFIDWVSIAIRFDCEDFPYFDDTIEALLEQKQKDIDEYVKQKSESLIVQVDKYGHEYGAVFADRYFSELGCRLCEMHDIDYVAMIDLSRGLISFRTNREDLSLCDEIAHSFSGGGHRKAAGGRFDGKSAADFVTSELFKGRWMA